MLPSGLFCNSSGSMTAPCVAILFFPMDVACVLPSMLVRNIPVMLLTSENKALDVPKSHTGRPLAP